MQGADIQSYDLTGCSGKRHRKEIVNFLDIQQISAHVKHVFTVWLTEEVYPHGIKVEKDTEQAFGWFSKKIESLSLTELNCRVRSSFN